ncbi:Signal transduction histidine kinase [Bryocella elongata]|uniref:histidine kinase n=1 Tax=Bryocella elongata TaxID=863522 RepID=A0A1H6AUS1_9BACT|nr:ATP-binding protein [Bryocella elongata]SEG52261.1 Signal transduction histidine kinase [Bryocella elongata]
MFGIFPQIDPPEASQASGPPRDARIWLVALCVLVCEVISTLVNNQSYKLDGASLVWLPNGIVMGALVSSRRKQWPALLGIGFVIDLMVNEIVGGPLITALTFALFNSIECFVGAVMLYRFLYPRARLTDWHQMRAFLLYGVMIAPAIASCLASLYLYVHHGIAFSKSWRFWYAADLLGLATATPLYLSYHHDRLFTGRSRRELTVLFVALCLVCVVVFDFSTYPTLWLVLLVLMLLGVRGGYTASALGLLLVIAIGGYFTIIGRGPLGTSISHSLGSRMFIFQAFTAVTMVVLYLTEVAVASNRAAQAALRKSEARYRSLADELELRVEERTLDLQHEITEREAVQNDLVHAKILAEEANHAKSAFLANMSHELRTPLNAILGYSEMLEDDAAEEGRMHVVEDLRRVQRAGHHLLHIINDVLDLAKIESGKIDVFPKKVEVSSIVTDLVGTIEPLAAANSNELRIEVESPAAIIEIDAVKFKQCLLNLLSNACKFTRDGTVILRIRASNDPALPGMNWEVQDSGIGISKADQLRLFRPFTQVDNTFTRRHDGTGLGLAISQRLIRIMGGDITVISEVGKGSTFTLHLPERLVNPATPAPSPVKHPVFATEVDA